MLAIGDPDFESYPEEPITAIKTDQSDGAARVVLRHTGTSCADFMAARWQPLPGARSEVRAVERAWASASPEKSDLLVGQFASETAFKDRSVGRRVIHLATHAYYLDGPCTSSVNENPLLRSGIILAGANLRGTTVGEKAVDDGVLTAFEVAAMDLEGTEMVVLSGCETGLGSNEQREGVYGLRRAFLMAGADRVVASLWPVDDRTTAALMARFYRDGGEPIYQRLRRAQLDRMVELRKRGVPDHPRDWGAFLLIGKP